jgi:hypothetical protein
MSGADGARTRGLRDAIAALSQLSYGPNSPYCNRELEVASPVDASPLIVPRGPEPKLKALMTGEYAGRQEIRPLKLGAVSCNEVDLIC